MNNLLVDVLTEASRLMFLGLLPMVGLVCIGSLLGTLLQASLAVQDNSFSFGVRFLAALLALYLFLPSVISSLIELAQMAYG